MIDDFARPGRKKPKVIQPLPKPERPPLPSLEGLAFKEPEFKTPEEVALDAEPQAVEHTDGTIAGHFKKPRKLSHRLKVLWPRGKWQRVAVSALAVLFMFGLGAAWTHFFHHTKPVQAVTTKPIVKKPVVVKPTTVPSTLTGLPVDPSVNERPVTAVMIENSPDARPQSGLDQAGIVFEALAEGGVTRFMALYQDTQPDYIGPVRSARPYYIQWALGFDAGYAHVGGSPEGLQDIKSWGVRDLDQFSNSGAYERVSTRYAPHNVYTSVAQLNQVETAKGYTSSNFTGFARKPDSPSAAPNATSIDMTFSGYYYNTHYDYDAVTNSYKRSEQGAPHMEVSKTGAQTQISPKVVVAMIVPWAYGALDSSNAYYSDYQTIGSGAATIFEDGTVIAGTWSKASNTAQLTFTDGSGQPLKLNAGQTWISALAKPSDLSYK
jgi:hypothetical protein